MSEEQTTNSTAKIHECGDIRAAWRHQRHKEPMDALCRKALNEYSRDVYNYRVRKQNFRNEAVAILIIRHEQEFNEILRGVEDGTI
jgi:hypothetical protein